MDVPTTATKLIFWAEDDLEDYELFKAIMYDISSEYRVEHFSNGKMLLDNLSNLSTEDYPNLIIMDMNMPVMSGLQTYQMIASNSQYNGMPVVLFTTSTSQMDKSICRMLRVRMVTKPNNIGEIRLRLAEILSYAREKKSSASYIA